MRAPDVASLAQRCPAARAGAAQYIEFGRYLPPQQDPRRMPLPQVFAALAKPRILETEV